MVEPKHTAFFPADYRLPDRQRAELLDRGIPPVCVAVIEEYIGFVKSYYATKPPTLSVQQELFLEIAQGLSGAAAALEKLDDLTEDILEAEVFRLRDHISPSSLRSTLRIYADAASKLELKYRPSHGPDASQSTHMAILVGEALRASGIKLDDSTKGPFVIATAIALEAIELRTADPRNSVRRAMRKLEAQNT